MRNEVGEGSMGMRREGEHARWEKCRVDKRVAWDVQGGGWMHGEHIFD